MNRFTVYTIAILLTTSSLAQVRQIDVQFIPDNEVLSDTFYKDEFKTISHSIVNLGPDSVRKGDAYWLDLKLGSTYINPIYISFTKGLGIGDSFSHSHTFKLNLPWTISGYWEFCQGVNKIFSYKGDTILKETEEEYNDNYYCARVNYVGNEVNYIPKVKRKPIIIYPNPSHDVLFISNLQSDYIQAYSIIDLRGQILDAQIVTSTSQNFSIQIDKLTSGTYTLLIKRKNKIEYRRFIKI